MDAEVQDAADQPPPQRTRDDARENSQDDTPEGTQPSWRAWFSKGEAGAAADDRADQVTRWDADPPEDEPPEDQPAIGGPAADDKPGLAGRLRRRRPAITPISFPLVSRPLVNPRLTADPRLRIWIIRALVCLLAFIAVTVWLDWRYGVTAAVIYAGADTLLRSRTTGVTPASVRVTSAQRSTARRLKLLQAAGYMTLNTRRIPGTDSVIDHVVVGPSGIYAVDSEHMDKRLPIIAKGGVLYHGPAGKEERLEHARFEAQRAAALIGAELGQRVRVRPTMVIYGPKLPWAVMRISGVDVFDGGHIGSYFRRQSKVTVGHHLDSGQIAMVFSAAAAALPPLAQAPGER